MCLYKHLSNSTKFYSTVCETLHMQVKNKHLKGQGWPRMKVENDEKCKYQK